ncbi:MAG: glyceraldehyde-3-phosphate dehydrogenase, partial [Burkholderiales bacterium]|nr:glyceraldehyde-3-phosphate dehydrogenase [Burkholderiales bacterium]
LTLAEKVSKEELNNYLRDVSLDSPLQNQIDYTNSPEAVSSDFVGSIYAGVIDSESTIAANDRVVLYVWYDNE